VQHNGGGGHGQTAWIDPGGDPSVRIKQSKATRRTNEAASSVGSERLK